MEQLSANGMSVFHSGAVVETKQAPAVKAGVKKPSVPKVKAKQPPKPRVTKKKSSNPVPNLKAVKTLLSGCPVTVSLSGSVTETPQESLKVQSQSSHSHHDEYLGWLASGRKSQYHPPAVKHGRVGVVRFDSVDLNDDSVTLTAESDDNVDSIKIDSTYTATADVHADNWKSDTW